MTKIEQVVEVLKKHQNYPAELDCECEDCVRERFELATAIDALYATPIPESLELEITNKVAELCNWCYWHKVAFFHSTNENYNHPELLDTVSQIIQLIQPIITKLQADLEAKDKELERANNRIDSIYLKNNTNTRRT